MAPRGLRRRGGGRRLGTADAGRPVPAGRAAHHVVQMLTGAVQLDRKALENAPSDAEVVADLHRAAVVPGLVLVPRSVRGRGRGQLGAGCPACWRASVSLWGRGWGTTLAPGAGSPFRHPMTLASKGSPSPHQGRAALPC